MSLNIPKEPLKKPPFCCESELWATPSSAIVRKSSLYLIGYSCGFLACLPRLATNCTLSLRNWVFQRLPHVVLRKANPLLLAVFLLSVGLSLFAPFHAIAQQRQRPKRVVTTFTIIQDMAQNVAGTAAIVESITKPGAEIHEYEPTPLDIVKAQSADLVLWNGFGLERWFEKFFSNVSNVPSAILTDGIEPLSISEGPYNGKPNPHSWMSPANAVVYVENIRKALVKLDPINESIYNANAETYSTKLKTIDAPIRKTLEEIPADRRWLVSSEGAFSYLTRNYGMKELFLWPVNADAEGTPQQVRRVVDTVRANNIPVVFSESTVSDKAMRQVAKETGTVFGGVLYVDSLTSDDGPAPTYLQLLEYNAKTIVNGFLATGQP